MFQHRERGLIQAYQIGATVILTALFWGLFLVLRVVDPTFRDTEFTNYFECFLALALGFQVSFLRARQQDVFSISSGLVESHRFIWPHILLAAVITFMFLIFTEDEAIRRSFLFTFLPLLYVVMLVFTRFAALDILRFMLRHQRQRLLLVGEPGELRNVGSLLSKAKLFGFEIVGMATESRQSDLPPGIRRLGAPAELEAILNREDGIGNIFILGSPRDRRMLGGWMHLAEARGCRVALVNDLDVFLQRRLSYYRCDGIDLIELREEPLLNIVNRVSKRTLDICVSLPVVCFILPPLMLLAWLAQRLQAPGPLVFRQQRSGIDNQPFTIFKFRTMYAGRADSGQQATARDERVFPLGRFFRRFSLDEFPQFFNVLLGNMSVVGPRPHMPQHDRVFAEKTSAYRIRGFAKPGITGLAQVLGYRGEAATPADVIRRVECDIEYIETWTLLLDLRIIWRTALQLIIPPRSAY